MTDTKISKGQMWDMYIANGMTGEKVLTDLEHFWLGWWVPIRAELKGY